MPTGKASAPDIVCGFYSLYNSLWVDSSVLKQRCFFPVYKSRMRVCCLGEHAEKEHCIQQGGDSALCFSIFGVMKFGEDAFTASDSDVQLMLQCISYVDLFCILEVFH